MTKIGLFYGTQTGYTETDAETIQTEFGGDTVVEIIDILAASKKWTFRSAIASAI